MIVWRVENDKGEGPYIHPRFHSYKLSDMAFAHRNSTHPDPFDENIKFDESYYCGFHNHSSVLEWFDGYIDILTEYNYKIVKYKANNVLLGKKQVMFKKSTARQICSIRLTL